MAMVEIGAWLAVIALVVFLLVCDILVRIPRVRRMGDRYVMITGCDTGFGNRIAKRLDKLGCHVFAGCYTETAETELRKECSGNLKTFQLDVSKEQSVRKALEFVKTNLPQGKGLWALINNAGIGGKAAPVEWLSMKDYREACDVNLFGLVDVTLAFLPLIKAEHGRIVNMASVMGRISLPGMSPYSVSKYGVESFSDGLRRQLRQFRTSVHIVEPGFFKTEITNAEYNERKLREAWAEASQEARDEYGEEFLNESIQKHIHEFLNTASEKVENVVSAYEHAVTAMFPRARYVVGADAKIFYIPLTYLPEWMSDLIFDAMAGPFKPVVLRK